MTPSGRSRQVVRTSALALAWLVNEVTGLGITIEPGEIVTTGGIHIPCRSNPATGSRRISAAWEAFRSASPGKGGVRSTSCACGAADTR